MAVVLCAARLAVGGWGRGDLIAHTVIGLAHYEWVHLLVHTRYRPKWPYYRGLARNHRRHHRRNEDYWLGVTSNTGDRLLRTLPRNPTDVRVSGTTRTLET